MKKLGDLKMAPNEFYEVLDFRNRDFSYKNIQKTVKHILAGINPNANIAAQMACMTVLSFADNQSITTETQKTVEEILLPQTGSYKTIKVQHDTRARGGDNVYIFNQSQKFDNMDALKSLGLAGFMTKNPKYEDKTDILQEIFIVDDF